MSKLIPLIYFYLVSLAGLVILVIGVFASVHFLVNIFSYADYPLPYETATRCMYPQPFPLMKGVSGSGSASLGIAQPINPGGPMQIWPPTYNDDCFQKVALERLQTKTQDLEKAVSYTLVGLVLFATHFYFARKKSA